MAKIQKTNAIHEQTMASDHATAGTNTTADVERKWFIPTTFTYSQTHGPLHIMPSEWPVMTDEEKARCVSERKTQSLRQKRSFLKQVRDKPPGDVDTRRFLSNGSVWGEACIGALHPGRSKSNKTSNAKSPPSETSSAAKT